MYSWGLSPFDPARAVAMLKEHRISHIVVENDRAVGSNWGTYMFTGGVVSWVAKRDDFRELPLKTPHMRLFERTDAPDTAR